MFFPLVPVIFGDGGAYLRREGLYSSLISEWRKQRDAGVLAGRRPGEKVGRLTAEQAEIARLTGELLGRAIGCAPPRPPWTSWEKHTLMRVIVIGCGWRRVW